jgi:hypothetical protein
MGVGSQDAEIDEEFRYRFGHHRAATISMDDVRGATVTVNGVVEEVFRHDRILGCGDPLSV